MLQGNAALSTTSAHAAGTDVIAHLATQQAALDFSNVTRARCAFEGLITNRGRTRDRDRRSTSMPCDSLSTPTQVRPSTLKVGVAESAEEFEATSRLICRRYAWRGYSLQAFEHENRLARRRDTRREITFFVADPLTTLGTITLRLDGPEGLRADETHGEAMRRARNSGGRIGELTRLAVAEEADSRVVLASLFGLVYTVGRFEHGVTDVFIEVNPRHVFFYTRAVGFVVAADAQLCQRVLAPSVLLHLKVDTLERRLAQREIAAADQPLKRYGT